MHTSLHLSKLISLGIRRYRLSNLWFESLLRRKKSSMMSFFIKCKREKKAKLLHLRLFLLYFVAKTHKSRGRTSFDLVAPQRSYISYVSFRPTHYSDFLERKWRCRICMQCLPLGFFFISHVAIFIICVTIVDLF